MSYGLLIIVVIAAVCGVGTATLCAVRPGRGVRAGIIVALMLASAGLLSAFAPLGDEYPGAASRVGIFIALATLESILLYFAWFAVKALQIIRRPPGL